MPDPSNTQEKIIIAKRKCLKRTTREQLNCSINTKGPWKIIYPLQFAQEPGQTNALKAILNFFITIVLTIASWCLGILKKEIIQLVETFLVLGGTAGGVTYGVIIQPQINSYNETTTMMPAIGNMFKMIPWPEDGCFEYLTCAEFNCWELACLPTCSQRLEKECPPNCTPYSWFVYCYLLPCNAKPGAVRWYISLYSNSFKRIQNGKLEHHADKLNRVVMAEAELGHYHYHQKMSIMYLLLNIFCIGTALVAAVTSIKKSI